MEWELLGPDDKTVQEHSSYEGEFHSLRDMLKGLWGFGFDALSALEGARWQMPGTEHLGLQNLPGSRPESDEPYIFHFPDGNAGVARAIVRQLIPDALPGHTMEDLVSTGVDYTRLDRASNATCRGATARRISRCVERVR